MLCTFSKIDPLLRITYYVSFASVSLYGSVTWNLQHPEISRVCAAWRVALRRIWRLPPNAHCDIVSALGSNHSLLDELCNRFMTFIVYCLSSHNCNSTVNFIVRNSLTVCRAQSPIGRNFLFICNRYNFCHELIFDVNNRSFFVPFSNFCRDRGR